MAILGKKTLATILAGTAATLTAGRANADKVLGYYVHPAAKPALTNYIGNNRDKALKKLKGLDTDGDKTITFKELIAGDVMTREDMRKALRQSKETRKKIRSSPQTATAAPIAQPSQEALQQVAAGTGIKKKSGTSNPVGGDSNPTTPSTTTPAKKEATRPKQVVKQSTTASRTSNNNTEATLNTLLEDVDHLERSQRTQLLSFGEGVLKNILQYSGLSDVLRYNGVTNLGKNSFYTFKLVNDDKKSFRLRRFMEYLVGKVDAEDKDVALERLCKDFGTYLSLNDNTGLEAENFFVTGKMNDCVVDRASWKRAGRRVYKGKGTRNVAPGHLFFREGETVGLSEEHLLGLLKPLYKLAVESAKNASESLQLPALPAPKPTLVVEEVPKDKTAPTVTLTGLLKEDHIDVTAIVADKGGLPKDSCNVTVNTIKTKWNTNKTTRDKANKKIIGTAYTLPVYEEGNDKVVVTCKDSAGNETKKTLEFTILGTLDTIAEALDKHVERFRLSAGLNGVNERTDQRADNYSGTGSAGTAQKHGGELNMELDSQVRLYRALDVFLRGEFQKSFDGRLKIDGNPSGKWNRRHYDLEGGLTVDVYKGMFVGAGAKVSALEEDLENTDDNGDVTKSRSTERTLPGWVVQVGYNGKKDWYLLSEFSQVYGREHSTSHKGLSGIGLADDGRSSEKYSTVTKLNLEGEKLWRHGAFIAGIQAKAGFGYKSAGTPHISLEGMTPEFRRTLEDKISRAGPEEQSSALLELGVPLGLAIGANSSITLTPYLQLFGGVEGSKSEGSKSIRGGAQFQIRY